jgi:hypothetical protein
MTLSIIGFLFIFNTAILHPFHVSVCEIYHNWKTRALEITLKIFIDDFELSIQNRGHSDFLISGINPEKVDKSPISSYLKDHFIIKLNNRSLLLDFLGFELQDDAILCYLEAKKIKNIGEIEIQNSILTEVFNDQVNLTHFQVKGEMKSIKTTIEKPSASVNF